MHGFLQAVGVEHTRWIELLAQALGNTTGRRRRGVEHTDRFIGLAMGLAHAEQGGMTARILCQLTYLCGVAGRCPHPTKRTMPLDQCIRKRSHGRRSLCHAQTPQASVCSRWREEVMGLFTARQPQRFSLSCGDMGARNTVTRSVTGHSGASRLNRRDRTTQSNNQ